jgi:hypothetical protein
MKVVRLQMWTLFVEESLGIGNSGGERIERVRGRREDATRIRAVRGCKGCSEIFAFVGPLSKSQH